MAAAAVWFALLSSGLCAAVMAGCPPTTVVSSLDLNKLMGPWYEHASLGTLFLYGLDRCKMTNFSLNSDEHTITMLHSRIPYLRSSQVFSTWTAAAKNPNPDGHLSLNLKLPVIGTIEAPLMVIDTDYDNYLVLYLCRNIGFFNFNAGYILTRKRSYSTADMNKIYASIDAALMQNKLQRSKFVLSNNKNCPAEVTEQTTSSSAADSSTLLEEKVPEETASTSSHGTEVHSESVGEESTTDEIKTDSSINKEQREETESTPSGGTGVQSESVGEKSTTTEIETDSSVKNEQKKETESTSNDTGVQSESVDEESADSSKDNKLKEKTISTSVEGATTVELESVDKTMGVGTTTENAKSSDSTVPLLSEVATGDGLDWTVSNNHGESGDTPAAA